MDRDGLLHAIEGPHTAEKAVDAVIEFVRAWMAENIDPWNFEDPTIVGTESEAWVEAMRNGSRATERDL